EPPPWQGWNAGRGDTQTSPRISSRPTCSSIRCADGSGPGRACASTCSTCQTRSDRRRNRWIPMLHRTNGKASAGLRPRAEDPLELVRSRDLELIVAAVGGCLVRTPAQERGRVAEPRALHVVVLHLADALDAERLPRQILAGAPAALAAGHPRHLGGVELRPL